FCGSVLDFGERPRMRRRARIVRAREEYMKRLCVGALAALAWSGAALAQDWPSRPVTMVVPYTAGGPVDTVSRILAARLSEVLGQQVIIENVGGAGGMTGSARVAKA